MVGYDGSHHAFTIQLPSPRGSRREEKISQLFRMLNGPLQKRVESRKRGLQFHMPAIVAIGQHCRLVESNSSIISLQDIYERHCVEAGMDKDDPIMAFTEKLKDIIAASRHVSNLHSNRSDFAGIKRFLQQPGFVTAAAKLEAYMEIAIKIFPDTIIRDVSLSVFVSQLGWTDLTYILQYFLRSTSSASDLWHTRKQFTLHMAAFLFQTYIFSIGRRTPSSLLVNRAGGQMFTSDLVAGHAPGKAEFANTEPVPFRLTPNIQNFITPIGIEGVLVTSVMSIARALTESEVSSVVSTEIHSISNHIPVPQYDLEHRLAIFVSDEVAYWHTSRKAPKPTDVQLRELTLTNVDAVCRRAKLLSCKIDREKVSSFDFYWLKKTASDNQTRFQLPIGANPVNQTLLDLVTHATNPLRLASMDPSLLPWL